jgi:hypothetical protein
VLYGLRYLEGRDDANTAELKRFVEHDLHYLDYRDTLAWYGRLGGLEWFDDNAKAFLGCNDRFFLLAVLLGRSDIRHPWLFARCREVEDNTDGYLDLWSRYHYKSTIITFAGSIQEIVRDPEITICVLSCTKPIAQAFLLQVQQEFENNELLKRIYRDVLWTDPKREASRWSRDKGIVVKRKQNPKEATIEAWGLVDGQPTSRHYRLLIYDDVVTQDLVGSPEMIKKVTERWELSDNLGTHGETRKQHAGTRYSFGDTYGIILERGVLQPRIYPATLDGTLDGEPVLLSPERWEQVKDAQRSTVAAQMLLNPVAGSEAVFLPQWFKPYDVRPTNLNVFITCDPSQGRSHSSDRTAIAVIGLDVAGNYYLLDGVRHRMPLSERYGHLKRFHSKWVDAIGVRSVTVGYEKYGMQSDLEVLKEWMDRDKYHFAIEELNFPREGLHAKPQRIGRLEPYFRKGRFYFPAVVWNPNVVGSVGSLAYWSIADATDEAHREGQIVYRPYKGPSKNQLAAEKTGQGYRIATPIKQIDEDRNVYDLTRTLMEEMIFFPFSPKDYLVDAVSRVFDLEPRSPNPHEAGMLETPVFEDS